MTLAAIEKPLQRYFSQKKTIELHGYLEGIQYNLQKILQGLAQELYVIWKRENIWMEEGPLWLFPCLASNASAIVISLYKENFQF